MHAAHQATSLICTQPRQPIKLPVLSLPFPGVGCSCRAIFFVQIALYVAILATLGLNLAANFNTGKSVLRVSAQVEEGTALITVGNAEEGKGNGKDKGRLIKGDSILLTSGDRIEIVNGVVLLTYFDGSVQRLSGTSFHIPHVSPAAQSSRLSIAYWFTRIMEGLNQPLRPNVTVASVLG